MFDIDGVFADFIYGYRTIANKLFKVPIYGVKEQKSWDFEDGDITKEQHLRIMEVINGSDNFWLNLPVIASDEDLEFTEALMDTAEVYFVTNRRIGINIWNQTAAWLDKQGLLLSNLVRLHYPRKGEFARALEPDWSLEDKAENAMMVAWLSPNTKSCLIDRPYNQYGNVGSKKVKRVNTITEFINKIKESNE